MHRRRYLGALGAAAVALAGCASDGSGTASGDDGTDGGGGTDGGTGTDRPGAGVDTDGAAPVGSGSATPDTSGQATPTPAPPSSATLTPVFPGYETTAVSVESPSGERLGAVTAAIADTPELRYTGLSDTRSLPADRGMLFVYESVADRTFVMRRMAFGIDIVYADADGTITGIHHAPAPGPDEDGSDQRYPGRGQYVLELVYDWTTDHGVSTGDALSFALDG